MTGDWVTGDWVMEDWVTGDWAGDWAVPEAVDARAAAQMVRETHSPRSLIR